MLDLSECVGGTDEHILGCGKNITNWYSSSGWLFYFDSKLMVLTIWALSENNNSGSGHTMTLSSTTVDLKIKADGVYVNDTYIPPSAFVEYGDTSGSYAIKAVANVKNMSTV